MERGQYLLAKGNVPSNQASRPLVPEAEAPTEPLGEPVRRLGEELAPEPENVPLASASRIRAFERVMPGVIAKKADFLY